MKCPKCGIAVPAGAADCSGCGVIFAKFAAQREREKKEAAEFLALAEAPRPSVPGKWPGRLIAGVLILVWCGGLFWYYVEALNKREERIQSELRARERAAALPPP